MDCALMESLNKTCSGDRSEVLGTGSDVRHQCSLRQAGAELLSSHCLSQSTVATRQGRETGSLALYLYSSVLRVSPELCK
jgi:hypothetical protein